MFKMLLLFELFDEINFTEPSSPKPIFFIQRDTFDILFWIV